uniref:Uncharacterized protein n=1 Tax=Macrostomum lignano TaxID=282301 RepID=A0A1I8GIR8_9PLAT
PSECTMQTMQNIKQEEYYRACSLAAGAPLAPVIQRLLKNRLGPTEHPDSRLRQQPAGLIADSLLDSAEGAGRRQHQRRAAAEVAVAAVAAAAAAAEEPATSRPTGDRK